ncbi:hypothetical protein [Ramlibacter alkalitolerans]|uniref:Uncharacterized protein n=1 Tax=Ramlibacter alkalitolerans TaxID=2039631 RepID=A0ABS1JTT9_9BURK|nr:hypothetical protein [Ramlibacter alkalitolerans]MBL0427705.1 hypothetical protein [Ramlibacter alkalitolerans]
MPTSSTLATPGDCPSNACVEQDVSTGDARVRAGTRERVQRTLADFRKAFRGFSNGYRQGMNLVLPMQE